MISTIFNELIVQIVSDFFPKPKAPPGVAMSITVHKPSPSFRSFPFLTSITVHKTNTNFTGILFLPFIQACLQANTNTNLTGIFIPSFYPSLLSSKHKHKCNRHFYSFFLSKPAFKQTKANNNYSKTQSKLKQSKSKQTRQDHP